MIPIVFSLPLSRVSTINIEKRGTKAVDDELELAFGTRELHFFGSFATDILDA